MTTRPVERRIVSVLFADLVGFTSLSERLDPEDVALVQDAYFDAVRETIGRHGGLLEKFVGDAAMAVFGAPRTRDDDAERAVRAALALVAAVGRLGATLGLDEGELVLRVGVNSGEAVYGEATAERGPVTGDAVNVAARLQAAADPGSVVVGEVTALAVADVVELEPRGAVELKGKATPVPVWHVVGVHPERSRERALAGLGAPLIGREQDLARLLRPLGRGGGRIVVVAPPGVGKTRLLDEHAREAQTRGAVVFRARLRPDLLSPFEPVGQLVRSAGAPEDVADRLPPGRARVVRAALAAVVAPGEADGLADEREQLFGAWLDGLDALAGGSPAVWQVEDLHWASPDLLAFLDVAARTTAERGRLVVGTARPALLDSASEWCAGGDLLHLATLPSRETASLVRALVGDALPGDLVERIAERSGGNALFVEELLRSWVTTGALERAPDGGWRLTVASQDASLPATVQAIYAGQLDDLPPPARSAARRAAVAGRRFALAALEPLQVGEPEEAVAALVRRAFVTDVPADPILGASYVYRHALLRDVGYASLARGERATLHAALADWLADRPEPEQAAFAEVIARHYAAALECAPALVRDVGGRDREALRGAAAAWFERAAGVAAAFAAWESARLLALRSLELTDEQEHERRGRRLLACGRSTANATGVEEAEPVIREALDCFRASEHPRAGLAEAGAVLADMMRAQTRFVEAHELAAGLVDELGGPDDVSLARLLAARAVAALNAWDDQERASADVERVLAIARAAGDEMLELEGLQLGSQIEAERGDDATGTLNHVEELARRAGRWDVVRGAIASRAGYLVDDEPDAALEVVARAAEVAADHGLVEGGAWCDYLRAEAHFASGCWDEAIADGLRAIELGEARDLHRVVVRSWFVLLPIAAARGDVELVRRAYPRFEARRGREPDSPYARIITTAVHLRFAVFGLEPSFVPDLEERRAGFDMDHAGPSWVAGIETVVESWLEAGELGAVGTALDRMSASLERSRGSGLARAVERLLRARLAQRRGDAAAGAALARASLARLPPPAAWWRGKAIRLLEEVGAADRALAAEAAAIEHRLGIGRQ